MEGVLTDGMFVGVLVGGMVCLKQCVLQSGLGWRGLARIGPIGFGGHVSVLRCVACGLLNDTWKAPFGSTIAPLSRLRSPSLPLSPITADILYTASLAATFVSSGGTMEQHAWWCLARNRCQGCGARSAPWRRQAFDGLRVVRLTMRFGTSEHVERWVQTACWDRAGGWLAWRTRSKATRRGG